MPDELGRLVRDYIDRVVNRKDLSAVDEMVSPDYSGGGHEWPEDRHAVRDFYARQAQQRPDWTIQVQETIEVGDWVAVRAHAGGSIQVNEDGTTISQPKRIEWLAVYQVAGRKIAQIRVLAVKDRSE